MRRKIFDAEEGEKRIQANPILGVDRYGRDRSVAVLRQNRSQAHLNLTSGTVVARKIERSIARAAEFFECLPCLRTHVAHDSPLDPNTARHKERNRHPTTKSGMARRPDREPLGGGWADR